MIPLRNFEISSNFSKIYSNSIRQDGGGDNILPMCDCGSGKDGRFSGGCYGDSFYLGIYGGLGVTIGLLSFTKSLTMLKGIIRNGCYPVKYRGLSNRSEGNYLIDLKNGHLRAKMTIFHKNFGFRGK